MIGLKEIEEARARSSVTLRPTPCVKSEPLSQLCGATVWLKMENLQRTGSFKDRGALNKLLQLTAEERARGVIGASAGNHAQGVAWHAGRLGIPATIVMPVRTPLVKVVNTRNFGATVVQYGNNLEESFLEARRIQQEQNLVFVHPFDDEAIVAGQGTIGLELVEQVPTMDFVICPIGGGGLIAGMAAALKEINPRVRIIGVQTAALPSMKKSLEAGEPLSLTPANTIADGIAVKRPGAMNLAYVQKFVDEVVTVDEEEIASAILLLLEREKAVVEGAGAASLAALLHGKIPAAAGRRVVLVLSGGNIDVNLISRIIERGLVKDGRLVRLLVSIQDRPGSLARVLTLLGEQGANVVDLWHERAFGSVGLGETQIEVTLETRGREHVTQLIAALEEQGYAAQNRAPTAMRP